MKAPLVVKATQAIDYTIELEDRYKKADIIWLPLPGWRWVSAGPNSMRHEQITEQQ